jgi:hypothetical protein
MSALPPKADIRPRDHDVRFGPEADIVQFTRLPHQRGKYGSPSKAVGGKQPTALPYRLNAALTLV